MIYHIALEDEWQAGLMAEQYQPANFEMDGFIHCSTYDQVLRVANKFFRGQSGLVLITIDDDQVEASLVYENLEGGDELFPHLYGPLNLNAVIDTAAFLPDEDGSFFEVPRLS